MNRQSRFYVPIGHCRAEGGEEALLSCCGQPGCPEAGDAWGVSTTAQQFLQPQLQSLLTPKDTDSSTF